MEKYRERIIKEIETSLRAIDLGQMQEMVQIILDAK